MTVEMLALIAANMFAQDTLFSIYFVPLCAGTMWWQMGVLTARNERSKIEKSINTFLSKQIDLTAEESKIINDNMKDLF